MSTEKKLSEQFRAWFKPLEAPGTGSVIKMGADIEALEQRAARAEEALSGVGDARVLLRDALHGAFDEVTTRDLLRQAMEKLIAVESGTGASSASAEKGEGKDMRTPRCSAVHSDGEGCCLPEGHAALHRSEKSIVWPGRGVAADATLETPAPDAKETPRCESRFNGRQCESPRGHRGHHGDPFFEAVWDDDHADKPAPDALGEAIERCPELAGMPSDPLQCALLEGHAGLHDCRRDIPAAAVFALLHQARAAHAEEMEELRMRYDRASVERTAARAEVEALKKELKSLEWAKKTGEVPNPDFGPSVDALVSWWRERKKEIEGRGGIPDLLFRAVGEDGTLWEFDADEIDALVTERDAALARAERAESEARAAKAEVERLYAITQRDASERAKRLDAAVVKAVKQAPGEIGVDAHDCAAMEEEVARLRYELTEAIAEREEARNERDESDVSIADAQAALADAGVKCGADGAVDVGIVRLAEDRDSLRSQLAAAQDEAGRVRETLESLRTAIRTEPKMHISEATRLDFVARIDAALSPAKEGP